MSKRVKVTQSFSLAPRPQTQNDAGKVLRKRNLPEDVVLLEREIKDRAETTLADTVRTSHVIIGILQCVKVTNQNRDANSVKSACSATMRLTVSLTRSRKRMEEKVLLLYCRIQSN